VIAPAQRGETDHLIWILQVIVVLLTCAPSLVNAMA
jgi:hypothetical protein